MNNYSFLDRQKESGKLKSRFLINRLRLILNMLKKTRTAQDSRKMLGRFCLALFWFIVNWRIRPYELVYINGGIHHAQTAEKLHRQGEGFYSQTAFG